MTSCQWKSGWWLLCVSDHPGNYNEDFPWDALGIEESYNSEQLAGVGGIVDRDLGFVM